MVRLLLSQPDWGWSKGKGRDDWQSEKLLKMVRELQPGIILNDRLDLPGAGDIKTPEQYQPRGWVTVDGKPVVWEACQTFTGSGATTATSMTGRAVTS